jgi:hypothetical protein
MKNTHTQQKRAEMKIQLERPSLTAELWQAPTVRDLLAIEREERNALIVEMLANEYDLDA